jgi:hypothetical protein
VYHILLEIKADSSLHLKHAATSLGKIPYTRHKLKLYHALPRKNIENIKNVYFRNSIFGQVIKGW